LENNHKIVFDEKIIKKYDKSGPRYTSYPTSIEFNDNFTQRDYRRWSRASNALNRPLSLYFHIPFCDTVCYYCGCNKIATKDRTRSMPYMEALKKEIVMQSMLFNKDKQVEQLHLGGGTPTFLNDGQLEDLITFTNKNFALKNDDSGEYSIEIDPREIGEQTLATLRELGFNRLSLGVQDFNYDVQVAVNRIQPINQTENAIKIGRDLKYHSISIDLIYGLPFQNIKSFSVTLDNIIRLSPDRVSVYNYAHLPKLFKPQRRINAATLPSPGEKLDILKMTIEKLHNAGYVYIGMDHFAKKTDELTIAQQNGTLQRNFQGYSTHANCDMIAMGLSSISNVGNTYSQNVRTEIEYYEKIEEGSLPIFRGIEFTGDDIVRQDIISQLICHLHLNTNIISKIYSINFWEYFKKEEADLLLMQKDGLLELDKNQITINSKGVLLIRNICMVFDAYLRKRQTTNFSKTI